MSGWSAKGGGGGMMELGVPWAFSPESDRLWDLSDGNCKTTKDLVL